LHLGLTLVLNELPFAAFLLAIPGLVFVFRTRNGPGRLALAWFAGTLLLVGVGGTELTLRFFFLPGTWLLALGISLALAAMGSRSRVWEMVAIALVLSGAVFRHAVADTPRPLTGFAMGNHIWQLSPGQWDPFRESLRYDEYGRGVMSRLPEDAVVLVGLWNQATTLRYFVFGEVLRPDVSVLLAGRRDPRLSRMWREAVEQGRPVFVTSEPEAGALPGTELEAVWDSGWAKLWRVVPARP